MKGEMFLTEMEALFELFSDPTEEVFEEIQKSFEGKSVEEKQRFDRISEFYFRNFVAPYGVDKAENAFFSILKQAMLENERESVLDPVKFEELCEIYEKFKEVFGDEAIIKFHPAFGSGSVIIKVPDVDMNDNKAQALKTILEKCNTFEVTPLVSGNLDIGVTFKGLFKSKTE